MMLQSGPAAWAPVLVAAATFVSALAGAIALLANAFRKRIESKLDTAVAQSVTNSTKLDAAAGVQDKIHEAVNGAREAALAEIAALKVEVARLQALLPKAGD